MKKYFDNRLKSLADDQPGRMPYRASSAGACPRQILLKRIGVEVSNPADTDTLWGFAVGHAIHRHLQQEVFAPLLKQCEVPFSLAVPGLPGPLIGHIDGLGYDVCGGNLVYEFKSTSAGNLKFIRDRGSASPHNVAQVQIYLHALNNGGVPGVEPGDYRKARIVYLCSERLTKPAKTRAGLTDGIGLLSYDIDYDQAVATAIIAEWVQIEAEYREGHNLSLIPFGYKLDKYPCSYCPFGVGPSGKSTCWFSAPTIWEVKK